ncbi:Clavaminate synthase-like protein [Lactarius indigo]|nr:Clavaminate synthase-like protein [Lactarius indigo]
MPDTTPPPFPDDVPTVPLLVIDYALLQARDEHEIDRLWKAATELGFWYLKNHGTDAEVDAMLEMGAYTMALPLEEKMKFEQGDGGISFGYTDPSIQTPFLLKRLYTSRYKFAGANATDATGALDSVEFINVSKDDALAFPTVVHRKYPRTVEERMDSVVRPFVRKSMEVNQTLMDTLNDRLVLPPGCLAKLHTPEEHSGSEARCIKKTPASTPEAPDKAAIGAHTDFGSLSFLHNRLGGLQVLPPGTDEWKYVKPIPGHAICNLGDAMAIFSAGILRSNLHRVVPPPKAQALFERWSLVFFTRPGHSVPLAPLIKESTLVAEAAARAPESRYATGSTAGDWFRRRIQNQRIKNRTGPETWMASRGTEHKEAY